MPGRRILSDDQLEEMIELREKGWDSQRIADHFTAAGTKVSRGSVEWQCLRLGADRPRKFHGKHTQPAAPYWRCGKLVRPFSKEDDTLLQVLDMQGFKISVISRRLGRPANSVRGRLYTLARRDERAETAA